MVGKVSSLSKRGYLVFENRTRNDAPTAIWSDLTDRFRTWSIDARHSRSRLCSLHCYGNSKSLGNTPFRRPSCQAREEKRKFSPTANSLRCRRQRSRTWTTAQRVAEERKWRPKVHQARRDDRFSSRFLSLLLTAAIVPTRPTPPLLCSPYCLSLSDQDWCIQICDCVNCTQYATNSRRATAAPRLSASLCGFYLWLVGFPGFRLGDWFT